MTLGDDKRKTLLDIRRWSSSGQSSFGLFQVVERGLARPSMSDGYPNAAAGCFLERHR
jgi:hypothetical protein